MTDVKAALVEGEPTGKGVRSIGAQRSWLGIVAVVVLIVAGGLANLLSKNAGREAGHELPKRQLTANPPEDRVVAAAISPNGKRLAYRELIAEAASPEGGQVWIISMVLGAAPHLVHRNAVESAIEPDGQSIAFLNGRSRWIPRWAQPTANLKGWPGGLTGSWVT